MMLILYISRPVGTVDCKPIELFQSDFGTNIKHYHAEARYIMFEKRVDPDQLASEKPADQDLHSCYSACN